MSEHESEPTPMPSDDDVRQRFERLRKKLDEGGTPVADEVELELRGHAMADHVASVAASAGAAAEFDEMDRRLVELAGRAKSTRVAHERSVGLDDAHVQSMSKVGRASGLGLVVAYMIIGFPLLFAGIGALVDRATGSKSWTGGLTLIGMVVGIAVTVSMVNRRAKDL